MDHNIMHQPTSWSPRGDPAEIPSKPPLAGEIRMELPWLEVSSSSGYPIAGWLMNYGKIPSRNGSFSWGVPRNDESESSMYDWDWLGCLMTRLTISGMHPEVCRSYFYQESLSTHRAQLNVDSTRFHNAIHKPVPISVILKIVHTLILGMIYWQFESHQLKIQGFMSVYLRSMMFVNKVER